MYDGLFILKVTPYDIRFPTSLRCGNPDPDAVSSYPDYSCAYVILETNTHIKAYGLTFTHGKGTHLVKEAIDTLGAKLLEAKVNDIFGNFVDYWRKITSDSQMRWLGPEKGITQLAAAALINALWDLWARLEGKPVWKLLVDMSPEQLTSVIDFSFIEDVITREEAIKMLREKEMEKASREAELKEHGYPAYITQVDWRQYSNEKVTQLFLRFLSRGFRAFKVKLEGQNLADDRKRCARVRETIGPDPVLMIDAMEKWSISEAIEKMKSLAEFKPICIEDPTSSDDILGHAKIAKALREFGIGVATGKMCCNRVMFKQFMQTGAIDFLKVDATRVGGINELLSIYLMAEKLKVKICPHACGLGLCETVQHIQFWDYVSLSGTKSGRYIEYMEQHHSEVFKTPAEIKSACYMPPMEPGLSTELLERTLEKNEYPNGLIWRIFDKEPQKS